jgi:hypothetical protein
MTINVKGHDDVTIKGERTHASSIAIAIAIGIRVGTLDSV